MRENDVREMQMHFFPLPASNYSPAAQGQFACVSHTQVNHMDDMNTYALRAELHFTGVDVGVIAKLCKVSWRCTVNGDTRCRT